MMTKLEQIEKEIERKKSALVRGACSAQVSFETSVKDEAYDEILAYVRGLQFEDSLPERFEPDLFRNILVKMKIDTVSNRTKISVGFSENGKPKETWTPAQRTCTARALVIAAQDLLEGACFDLIRKEEEEET